MSIFKSSPPHTEYGVRTSDGRVETHHANGDAYTRYTADSRRHYLQGMGRHYKIPTLLTAEVVVRQGDEEWRVEEMAS